MEFKSYWCRCKFNYLTSDLNFFLNIVGALTHKLLYLELFCMNSPDFQAGEVQKKGFVKLFKYKN